MSTTFYTHYKNGENITKVNSKKFVNKKNFFVNLYILFKIQ